MNYHDLAPDEQARCEPLTFGAEAMRALRRYGWIDRQSVRTMTDDERRAYDARTRNASARRRHIKRADI